MKTIIHEDDPSGYKDQVVSGKKQAVRTETDICGNGRHSGK